MKQKQIQKKTVRVFGKRHFLLGTKVDGTKVYLQEAKFNCGWYWGFGYIETFTNNAQPENSRDISSHSHWDSSIVGHDIVRHDINNNNKYVHHINDNGTFKNTVLSENESWTLTELMKSFYVLQETAELYSHGSAHITENKALNPYLIMMKKEWYTINTVYIPAVLSEIEKLLCGENDYTPANVFSEVSQYAIKKEEGEN